MTAENLACALTPCIMHPHPFIPFSSIHSQAFTSRASLHSAADVRLKSVLGDSLQLPVECDTPGPGCSSGSKKRIAAAQDNTHVLKSVGRRMPSSLCPYGGPFFKMLICDAVLRGAHISNCCSPTVSEGKGTGLRQIITPQYTQS